jgi:mono/diheme cytochrome c family protein
MHRAWNLTLAFVLAGTLATMTSPGTARAEADKKTIRTWKAKCSSCHGEDGKGATEQGKKMGVRDMTSAEFAKETDAKMKESITNGLKQKSKDGKAQEMEPYKDKLKPEEIDNLVAYVKSLKK